MIEQVRLRDGTNAFVLPLERTDKATLAAEYETLAPESQRRRFLAPVLHLTDSMLEHLVDDVDGIDHIALVLCVEASPGVYDPVALARMVRYVDVPDAADLAVTVKDEWQGCGVATTLLELLMRERPTGVDRIVTEVFSDNRASLAMLHRLGRTFVDDLGGGLTEVTVDLHPRTSRLPRKSAPPRDGADQDPRERMPAAVGVTGVPALLRDPAHRHALRTRDKICPWFS
ncbi:MAG: GCN5-related N-acetyltransferase [Nocardioides sp.]|jgi:RimJ/RimL family protein N-acetyltransferase|uniref:GNAT family N-acetyltransferase n=1 Tax=Nocardioides sp. TaxID=35761 RepID=UPI00260E87F1|nr:GNAT family N-acetyltransferase [Nocardioides sp.]MCW2834529.1 GCN5-related N-acetyltransferase [Nocardioides sp.]